MTTNRPFNVLDDVAKDFIPDNTNLTPRLAAQLERKSIMFTLRTRPFVAVALALFVLLALTGVAYAIGRSLGYIPGVGIIDQSAPIRILDKSFTIERDNVDLTIEQVVAGADMTIVVYHYFVPLFDPSAYQVPMDTSMDNPALILPDGSKVVVRVGNRIASDEPPLDADEPIRYSLEFPSLANDVMEITLELPYLPGIPPGTGPQNLQIPLKLIPAPKNFIMPVFEVEGNYAGDQSPVETAPSFSEYPSSDTNVRHGITASVDLFVPLEDGYLLIGSMQWNEKDYPAHSVMLSDYIRVTDATGEEIPFEPMLGTPEQPQDEDYRSYWTVKVLQKDFTAPLNIIIDSAIVDTYTQPFSFQFDPGPSPVIGQNWEINQDFQIGDIQARILKATLTTAGSPDWSFDFTVQASPNELADVYINLEINQCGGGGGSYPTQPAETIQVSASSCRTDLPSGPLEAGVIGALMWGPWQVEWTPPTTMTVPSPTPTVVSSIPTTPPIIHTKACLNYQSWNQSLKRNDPIPPTLSGRLVLSDPTAGETISIVNLSNGEQKNITRGDAPSYSPDGQKIVLTGPINGQPPDGLYVTDLASGNTTRLPSTANGDSAPLWSPDGAMIAFTRGPAGAIGTPGPYNVMLMNSDGSNLRQLTYGSEKNQATTWTPDGLNIIYTVYNSLSSSSVRMVNIQTGETLDLFDTSYWGSSIAISPDGKRAAYEDWMPGEIYILVVSSLDGSNRSLLAQGNETIVSAPKWSPDGQWVIVTVQSANSDGILMLTPTLIQVDSCQIIPLRDLNGYVGSWLP